MGLKDERLLAYSSETKMGRDEIWQIINKAPEAGDEQEIGNTPETGELSRAGEERKASEMQGAEKKPEVELSRKAGGKLGR